MRHRTVSVIMAVHGGQRYLRASVESILGQTPGDFEFVIVDDGSGEEAAAILAGYARADDRIVLLRNQAQVGLTRSLNRGLEAARGRYVARQDADDISLSGRLAAQVEYFHDHRDVGLLGTAYAEMDSDGRVGTIYRPPAGDTGIRWRMLFHNAFCHSSVMFRRELLGGGVRAYDPAMPYAQDYDLWARLLRRTRGANLEQPLLYRRVHADSITARRVGEQARICTRVSAGLLQDLVPWLGLTLGEVARLREWTARLPERLTAADWPLCRRFLEILAAFEAQEGIDRSVVACIRDCWHTRVRAAVGEQAWSEMAGLAQAREERQ